MTSESGTNDILADPFLERPLRGRSVEHWILGGRFRFTSASEALLALVDAAYGGLPDHVLPVTSSVLEIELRLTPHCAGWHGDEPPPVNLQSGAGLLCGVMDAANFVVMAPDAGRALVVVSEDLLAFPYHLRYELIEFAVFTLATRVQQLVPLHGACLGREGRGLLIVGSSGAGKSTLVLRAVLEGLEVLAEDAVFVHPQSLRATGVANYLHVRPDGLAWVDDERHRRWISDSPMIRRRSGVEKFEVDLRKGPASLAASPVELAGIVFVTPPEPGESPARWRPIDRDSLSARLVAEQPYAAGQAGWDDFMRGLSRLTACELVRGRHPADSVRALMPLLD
ncbi:serine kinase [Dyella japonica]|nr:serine kinase [Dyella japonica]